MVEKVYQLSGMCRGGLSFVLFAPALWVGTGGVLEGMLTRSLAQMVASGVILIVCVEVVESWLHSQTNDAMQKMYVQRTRVCLALQRREIHRCSNDPLAIRVFVMPTNCLSCVLLKINEVGVLC